MNADGSLHLPSPENASRTPALDAEAAAAAAARAEANAELERQALAYMARKMTEQVSYMLCEAPLLRCALYQPCAPVLPGAAVCRGQQRERADAVGGAPSAGRA